MRRYGLRDDQWERIGDLLPGQEGHRGVTAADNCAVCRSDDMEVPQRRAVARSAASVSGIGKTSTAASAAGPRAAFGGVFSSIWRLMPIMNM